MICLATAAGILALAVDQFTLRWTHSVSRTTWEEIWQASPQGLAPVEAYIEGPGAGMELPEAAWRDGHGWRYHPQVHPQAEVFLAASGSTGAGWQICTASFCQEVGAVAGQPLRLWQAAACPV